MSVDAGSVSPERSDTPTASTRRRGFVVPTDVIVLLPVVLAIIGVSIYATTQSDEFLTLGNFQNIFQQVAVLGVISVGTCLLMVAGDLDLSIGSGVSLASVVGAKMLTSGVSGPWVIVVIIGMMAAIGVAIGLVISLTRVAPFILTLGVLSVLSAAAAIVSDTQPIPSGLELSNLSLESAGPVPLPAIVFGGLLAAAGILLRYTRLGRNAYAMGSNEEAAYLAGVPVVRTRLLLYALSGATVGLGGIMFIARVGSGDPVGGAGLELEAITAVVLGGATLAGGRGGVIGTFLGVFFLGVMGNALQLADVANSYEQLVFGLVLAIAVTWAALGEKWRGTGRNPFSRLLHRDAPPALEREASPPPA